MSVKKQVLINMREIFQDLILKYNFNKVSLFFELYGKFQYNFRKTNITILKILFFTFTLRVNEYYKYLYFKIFKF